MLQISAQEAKEILDIDRNDLYNMFTLKILARALEGHNKLNISLHKNVAHSDALKLNATIKHSGFNVKMNKIHGQYSFFIRWD